MKGLAPARLVGQCVSALSDVLLRANPHCRIDEKHYAATTEMMLIEGVSLSEIEADFREGAGNELEGKFRAARSSSALAANCFAPFKRRPSDLILTGATEVNSVRFEAKCPTEVSKALRTQPPHLDLLVESDRGVVGVESKCLEYLSPKTPKFRPAYSEHIQAARDTRWFEHMRELMDRPDTYRWLDASQLIKHAFGLAHTYPGPETTVLYLFWEPENPDAHPLFREHREEAANFASAVDGPGPKFEFLSYPELWDGWFTNGPDWLKSHVSRLRERYLVSIPE